MKYQVRHYPALGGTDGSYSRYPESWTVQYYADTWPDYRLIDDMQQWVVEHEYRDCITSTRNNLGNYSVEFERESEYMEFVLRWL